MSGWGDSFTGGGGGGGGDMGILSVGDNIA